MRQVLNKTVITKAKHLLGHFCRATGYDPSGSVTVHLTELFELLQSGTKAWDVHRAIDTYSENISVDPENQFNDFMQQFTVDDISIELPGNTNGSMYD